MNIARWVLAHEMQLDRQRWQMRQWARLFGTDMDALQEDATESGFGDSPRVFPLAGLLNPESYNNFINREEGSGVFEETPLDQYEAQVAAMEKGGLLSDIDMMGSEADKKAQIKKDKMYGVIVEDDAKP